MKVGGVGVELRSWLDMKMGDDEGDEVGMREMMGGEVRQQARTRHTRPLIKINK